MTSTEAGFDYAAAARLAEFQRLLAELDSRDMAKLEAFMRGLGASERRAGVS